MLTYQLQNRMFKIEKGKPLKFPNKMVIEIKFSPPEAFGTSDGLSRLVLANRPANMILNNMKTRLKKPKIKDIINESFSS